MDSPYNRIFNKSHQKSVVKRLRECTNDVQFKDRFGVQNDPKIGHLGVQINLCQKRNMTTDCSWNSFST